VNQTSYILDTADKRFADQVWHARDVITCAPCIDLAPGTNRDTFAGECKLWWSERPDIKAIHIARFGAAFLPGQWLGPQSIAQYREQLLGGFSRHGSDAVWLDEISATFDRIKAWPDFVYLSTEDQAQVFELPNDHPTWAYIDGLTGDKRLPRNLRYTTAYGLKKITSLSAWLQTRTPYVRQCWYSFFNPIQWGQMSACWKQSRLGHLPACSWNQPNYSWTDPATWEKEAANCIAPGTHLPMYDSSPKWLARYREVLEYTDGNLVAHVRPDGDFVEQLKLIDEFNVPIALVFCDPTRIEAWQAGIGPFIDAIRNVREE
jgi:hypothetical protein